MLHALTDGPTSYVVNKRLYSEIISDQWQGNGQEEHNDWHGKSRSQDFFYILFSTMLNAIHPPPAVSLQPTILKTFLPSPSLSLPHPLSHHPIIVTQLSLSVSLRVLPSHRNPFNRVRTFSSPPSGIYLVQLMDSWEMTTGRMGGRGRGRMASVSFSFVWNIVWIGDRLNHIIVL